MKAGYFRFFHTQPRRLAPQKLLHNVHERRFGHVLPCIYCLLSRLRGSGLIHKSEAHYAALDKLSDIYIQRGALPRQCRRWNSVARGDAGRRGFQGRGHA